MNEPGTVNRPPSSTLTGPVVVLLALALADYALHRRYVRTEAAQVRPIRLLNVS